jgi:predicted small secreted protein
MNPILIPERRCQHSKPSFFRIATMAAGILILGTAALSTSCSTARGFGRDVEKAGDKIQEAASN